MPLLDLMWSMLWIFLLFAWFWLVITIFIDIFRSDDLGGVAKALWILFVLLIPWLGVLVYVIVRGQSMQERQIKQATDAAKAQRAYIQEVASSSTADELTKLKSLHDQGILTDEEFAAQKAKALG